MKRTLFTAIFLLAFACQLYAAGLVFDAGGPIISAPAESSLAMTITQQTVIEQYIREGAGVDMDATFTSAFTETYANKRIVPTVTENTYGLPITLKNISTNICADTDLVNMLVRARPVIGTCYESALVGTAFKKQRLPVTVSYSSSTATLYSFREGTFGKVVADQLTGLISGTTSGNVATKRQMYSTYDRGSNNFVRNVNSWAYPHKGLTSISSHQVFLQAAVLISPLHVVSGHGAIPSTNDIVFTPISGNPIVRRVVASEVINSTDDYWRSAYFVGLLNEPVPVCEGSNTADCIRPARFFDPGYLNRTGGKAAIPVVSACQHNYIAVRDWVPGQRCFRIPTDETRALLYDSIVGGDSGAAAGALVGDDFVLITTFFYGGPGCGPVYNEHLDDIAARMASLQGGSSPYVPLTIDTTSYLSDWWKDRTAPEWWYVISGIWQPTTASWGSYPMESGQILFLVLSGPSSYFWTRDFKPSHARITFTGETQLRFTVLAGTQTVMQIVASGQSMALMSPESYDEITAVAIDATGAFNVTKIEFY